MNRFSFQLPLFELGQETASQAKATEVVEPYLPYFADAFFEAFSEFKTNIDPETLNRLSKRVRGQTVNDLVCDHVRDQLTDQEGIKFCDRLSFFKVIIDDQIVVRFKRLNRDLLAASQDTEQACDWFSNKPLSGIPDHLLRVNFGFHASADWLSCEHFFFTHQNSFYDLAWVSEVQVTHEDETVQEENHTLPKIRLKELNRPAVRLDEEQQA